MYDLGRFGQGSVYLYAVPTSESPVLKSAFSHQWTKEHWDFKTTTSYENWWAKHELKSDNRLKLTLPSTKRRRPLSTRRTPRPPFRNNGIWGSAGRRISPRGGA